MIKIALTILVVLSFSAQAEQKSGNPAIATIETANKISAADLKCRTSKDCDAIPAGLK